MRPSELGRYPLKAMNTHIKRLPLLLSGSAILAFGLCHIHAHAPITEGGILGLILLLDHHLGLSPAITSIILNALCYAIGLRMLGRGFLIDSAIAAGSFSVFYALFDLLPPILAPINEIPILAALVGAMAVGLGCGLAIRAGGAPSGDDALAMAISKRLGCRISTVYLLFDLAVLLLSLTYIPLEKILYSLLTVFLSGQIVGFLQKPRRAAANTEKT